MASYYPPGMLESDLDGYYFTDYEEDDRRTDDDMYWWEQEWDMLDPFLDY